LGETGGIDALAGGEIDALHPLLTHDLAQEILDHAPMAEEEAVAEVVLSHDLTGRDFIT
jgi:hypothetical protein